MQNCNLCDFIGMESIFNWYLVGYVFKNLGMIPVKFEKSKFVFAVFLSPSGNGIKVLIKIPADADNHKKYFNALRKIHIRI